MAANADARSDEQRVDHSLSPIAARAKEVLRARCRECHGGAATHGDITILDRKSLVEDKQVAVPGDPERSLLVRLISNAGNRRMPPEGRPPLSADEIETLRAWIVAGAPDFPPDVARPADTQKDAGLEELPGVDYVLKKILEHQASASDDSRLYLRYFSINHFLSSGSTPQALDVVRDALSKAVNHVSTEPKIVRPVAIDAPHNTVYAVDIRKLGWQKQLLDHVEDGKAGERSDIDLFDLVLLEYPYGVVYESSPTFQRLLEQYCLPAGLVRPVPFVRADWFISAALQPPLYHDLLQLPDEVKQLETRLGVNAEDNVRNGVARRAGLAVSGVSRNNRVIERHPASTGAYWKSYDFRTSKGADNCFRNPIELHPAGGEMIFNLPNGLQGYFLASGAGRRLDSAPTDMVVDRHAEDKTVRNGLSCIRCHDHGIKQFADVMRQALERTPNSPGFDRRLALQLYSPREEMQSWVEEDRQRFAAALKQTLGHASATEPVTPVSQRFLDGPLSLLDASGELGLSDASSLDRLFRTPHLIGLGTIPLASGGVVRRDMWEDYFDQVVRALGLGTPVVPIDGLTRSDYSSQKIDVDIHDQQVQRRVCPRRRTGRDREEPRRHDFARGTPRRGDARRDGRARPGSRQDRAGKGTAFSGDRRH